MRDDQAVATVDSTRPTRHERKALHEQRLRELRVLIHDAGVPVDAAFDDEELRRWR